MHRNVGMAFFIGLFVVLMCECSRPLVSTATRSALLPKTSTRAMREEAQNLFIQAIMAQQFGYEKEAQSLFEKALASHSESNYLRALVVEGQTRNGKKLQATITLKNGKSTADLSDSELRDLVKLSFYNNNFLEAKSALGYLKKPTGADTVSLAFCYEQQNNYATACTLYSTQWNAENPSLVLGTKLVRSALLCDNPACADTVATTLCLHFPKAFEPHLFGGFAALLMHDTLKATARFEMARVLDSNSQTVLQTLGELYSTFGDYEGSAACFLRQDSGKVPAQSSRIVTLVMTYFYAGDYGNAEKQLQRLTGTDTATILLQARCKALIFESLERYDSALVALKKSFAFDPSDPLIWERIVGLHFKQHDTATALIEAQKVCATRRDSSLEINFLATVFMTAQKFRTADSLLAILAKRDTSNLAIIVNRSLCAEGLGDTAQSLRFQFEILKRLPNNATTLNHIAYTWAEQNTHLDSAEQFINRALTLEPTNGAILDSYAWILHKQGQDSLALTVQLKAVDCIEFDPVPYEHLGDIYRACSKASDAARAYQKAIDLTRGSIQSLVLKRSSVLQNGVAK